MKNKKNNSTINKFYKIIGIFSIVYCLFTATILFTSYMIEENSIKIKEYVEITVLPGENLWSIAKNYNENSSHDIRSIIYEINQLNELENSNIYANQKLLIPIVE